MTPENWKRVEELFHDASELPLDQRGAFLDDACGGEPDIRKQVDSLLAADAGGAGSAVKQQVVRGLIHFHAASPALAKEKRVGPYRLVREIGRGGMGTVYLAERADDQYEGQVAIKLVRPGLDTDFFLSRFRRERQTLARLHHPNIARLLDSGTTDDGLPYIVMEYIEGSHITDYCATKHLDVNEIISLILPVCNAVSHAHQSFVVHRDIKPGNILVDESGSPKLLDFGVCKLLYRDSQTSSAVTRNEIIMTPDYGSPEQVRGEPITVASDVYSLGAVLYELLTKQRVHVFEKLTPQHIEHVICETEIKRPSMAAADRLLSRKLAGDIDNILLRALHKQPERRYESAEQFAADLQRYLRNLPIVARPDTLRYRAGKFVVRNRAALATALAITGALTFGIVISIREASIARRHFGAARELANAFVFDVHDEIKNLPGSLRARQKILTLGLKYLDSLSGDARNDADLRQELAAAYERIGEVQGNVLGSNTGETATGLDSLRKALSLLEELPSTRERELQKAAIYNRVGDMLWGTRQASEAKGAYERAIRITDGLLGASAADSQARQRRANVLLAIGRMQRDSLDWTGSLSSMQEAKQLFEEELKLRPGNRELRANVASAASNLANAYFGLDQLQRAKEDFLTATAMWDQLCQADPLNNFYSRQRMLAYSHLGDLLGNPNYSNLNDWEGARKAFETMVAIAKSLHDGDLADRGALLDYGMALMHSAAVPDSNRERKQAVLQNSADVLISVAAANPSNVMPSLNLASVYEQMGDIDSESHDAARARKAYERSASISEDLIGAGRASAARIFITSSRKIAEIDALAGRADESLRRMQRVIQAGEKAASAPDAALAIRTLAPRAYAGMGQVYHLLNREPEARIWMERALSAFRPLQSSKEFTMLHRREMQAVEEFLAHK